MNYDDLQPGDVVSGRVRVGGIDVTNTVRTDIPVYPLCRDCRFDRTERVAPTDRHDDGKRRFCYAPESDGHPTYFSREFICGIEGRLFEPRRPWYRRLLRRAFRSAAR